MLISCYQNICLFICTKTFSCTKNKIFLIMVWLGMQNNIHHSFNIVHNNMYTKEYFIGRNGKNYPKFSRWMGVSTHLWSRNSNTRRKLYMYIFKTATTHKINCKTKNSDRHKRIELNLQKKITKTSKYKKWKT